MKDARKMYATHYCFEECKWIRIKDGMIYCRRYSAKITMDLISTINEECAEYNNINIF